MEKAIIKTNKGVREMAQSVKLLKHEDLARIHRKI